MSKLSDINHISDTLEPCAPAQNGEAPVPTDVFPLLGLLLILLSAALTCSAAYYLLVG